MFCAAELVAGGGLSWLGLVCGAEALKKLPRKPSGAEARRREAPEGRSGAEKLASNFPFGMLRLRKRCLSSSKIVFCCFTSFPASCCAGTTRKT